MVDRLKGTLKAELAALRGESGAGADGDGETRRCWVLSLTLRKRRRFN
jgi:hypothetical protein